MVTANPYQNDIKQIISHIHDNGSDFWTTPDKRLLKGGAFSAYSSAMLLLELGMPSSDPLLQGVADLFLGTWKEDGRFKLYPTGGILPCQTAYALVLLCHMGYQNDQRIQKTFQHFLTTPYNDGGWRCNKFFYGRGPETEFSNPLPTLKVLDAFRFSDYLNNEPLLDNAVEFLLSHWTIKRPIGPCQYGIGKRFMRVEYPLGDYNLFYYVYVLSFYSKARDDDRFNEAYKILESKLVDGQVVVGHTPQKLAGFDFCKKGEGSELATRRYNEIAKNLK